VRAALKEADKAEAKKGASASPSASASPTKKATSNPGKSDNLSDSCAYHPNK
jgi:hypothetical protein